jgi:hypothetical protein
VGNPITDLWHVAVSGWDAITRAYGNTWRDMYDVVDFYKFKADVQDAFSQLGQAVEFVAVLNATSAADTVSIGRDTAVNTRNALDFLRYVYVPAEADNARNEAINWAAREIRITADVLERFLRAEHRAMLLRVLEEELGRDVAIAREHADMVTRVAIERYDRTLMVQAAVRQLTDLIAKTKADILAYVNQVRQQLSAQIAQLSAYAHSIPGLVDSEAAGGYDPTLQAHATAVTRLLDAAVAHEPLIAGIVGRLAGFLVDLAEVDNPLLRIAAQLILKEIIDRVGLDTALGAMLRDLLGPVLGGGKPKTLKDVTAAVGDRLNGAEHALAQLAPLAPEADQLREMGTLAFDAALLAYLAAAVAAPQAAADDTVAALEPVTGPLLAPVRSLLGMG